jgi:hypothetical protein
VKYLELVLAAVAFITGLLAAWYWYKASRIQTVPKWGYSGEGHWAQALGQHRWTEELITSTSESARLNKIAALWTAVAVMLNALAALIAFIA